MFSEEELRRYSRQIQLSEIGIEGQKKLQQSKVLVIGAGGLGSPLLIYLAAAGVGTLGIVDGDIVDIHNLHRQVIHPTKNIGFLKTVSAEESLISVNPEISVKSYSYFLTTENIDQILSEYDLVVNATDNFETRYLVNDSCVRHKKIFVDASIYKFYGQIAVYKPDEGCYKCLYPEAPPKDIIPTPDKSGIFGPLAGFMGIFQSSEVIKSLLGIGSSSVGKLIFVDLLNGEFKTTMWGKNDDCTVCGK